MNLINKNNSKINKCNNNSMFKSTNHNFKILKILLCKINNNKNNNKNKNKNKKQRSLIKTHF